MTEGQFFECSGGFSEKDKLKRTIRPIRQRDLNRFYSDFPDGLQSRAIDISRGTLFHPTWKIPRAQSLYRSVGIVIEFARNARYVTGIGPGDGMQDEHGIFDVARHRTQFIERPAKRH